MSRARALEPRSRAGTSLAPSLEMSLARLFDQHTWVVGLPVVVIAAVLTGEAAAASFGADLETPTCVRDGAVRRARRAPPPAPPPRARSADAILSRNPFDHESIPPRPHDDAPARTPPRQPEAPLAQRVRGLIRRVGPNEIRIDRRAVDMILEGQAALMHATRVVPEQRDGAIIGVRVFGIRSSSPARLLGLENGDVLLTINGYSIASPDRALEAYARLRSADVLSLLLVRRGRVMTMRYVIV